MHIYLQNVQNQSQGGKRDPMEKFTKVPKDIE